MLRPAKNLNNNVTALKFSLNDEFLFKKLFEILKCVKNRCYYQNV